MTAAAAASVENEQTELETALRNGQSDSSEEERRDC